VAALRTHSNRYDAGSAQIGHQFYVFGGYANGGKVVDSVAVLDLKNPPLGT